MKIPPRRSGKVLHGLLQEPNQKRKPPIKTKRSRFDTLVAHYYPAVYSFASRLTDDPREAVLLTRDAFNSTQKQLWCCRDEVALETILLTGVIRAALTAACAELAFDLDWRQDGVPPFVVPSFGHSVRSRHGCSSTIPNTC